MENIVIQTKKGKIRAYRQGVAYVFKGIPYAKAPIGDLRWKAPQETEVWDGFNRKGYHAAVLIYSTADSAPGKNN